MAEPARKRQSDYSPEIRPKLGVIQGGGEGDGQSRGKLSPVSDTGSSLQEQEENPDRPNLRAIEGGGEGGIAEAEKQGGFYKDSDSDDEDEESGGEDGLWNGPEKTKKKGRFRLSRRNIAIGSTLTGITLTGAFGLLSVVQGPLEFVHIAQLLEKFHFAAIEDTEDSRLMRIARYLKDPSKPQNVRMGVVGNSIADKLHDRIKEKTGYEMTYDKTTGKFLGYKIDRTHENFSGMTESEIKNHIAKTTGLDPSFISVTDGEIMVNPEKGGFASSVKDYFAQTKFNRQLLKSAGLKGMSARVGTRVLAERSGWTFHPMKKLDAEVRNAAIKKGAKGIKQLKDSYNKNKVKVISGEVSATPITATDDSEKNPDGSSKDQTPGKIAEDANSRNTDSEETAKQISEGDKNAESKYKGKLAKGAGSALGLAGIMCIVQGLSHRIEADKQDKAILPMMRMASHAVTLGSQVMSGDDIDMLQLGFDKDSLESKDDNGKTTSIWSEAASIQAELGNTPNENYDIPQSGQVFDGNPVDFLDNIGALNTFCKVFSSPVGIVVGIATAPVSFVPSTLAIDKATSMAAGWLSGAPVNPLASGADYGNFINYGAKLSANQAFSAAGGVALDAADIVAMKDSVNGLSQEEFQSQGLAYRLFSPNDSRTLAAKFIDSQGNSNVPEKFATVFSGFGNIFGSIAKNVGSLFLGLGHASAASSYNYHGVKTIGFTSGQLKDPRFDNPFDNACYVAGGGCKLSNGQIITTGILDSSNGKDYIDLAEKCFGTKIGGDSASGWTIDKKSPSGDMYGSNDQYPSDKCKSDDEDWLRLRFWLLDTAAIEGYDCYQGDTTTSSDSCSDAGFNNSGSGSSGTSGGTTTGVSGNGDGKFTTDTSHAGYPGLDQMLARVEATKDSSGAASFCAAIGGCSGRCESAVEWAWLGHKGQYGSPFGNAGNTPSQGTAWAAALASGHAHAGDRNPPVGALLVYNKHDPSDPWGHITIYVGNNLVFSTDFDHQGSVGVQSASHIESGSWANSYVGWMDPYFSGKVGN
jgi:hypothetical protein